MKNSTTSFIVLLFATLLFGGAKGQTSADILQSGNAMCAQCSFDLQAEVVQNSTCIANGEICVSLVGDIDVSGVSIQLARTEGYYNEFAQQNGHCFKGLMPGNYRITATATCKGGGKPITRIEKATIRQDYSPLKVGTSGKWSSIKCVPTGAISIDISDGVPPYHIFITQKPELYKGETEFETSKKYLRLDSLAMGNYIIKVSDRCSYEVSLLVTIDKVADSEISISNYYPRYPSLKCLPTGAVTLKIWAPANPYHVVISENPLDYTGKVRFEQPDYSGNLPIDNLAAGNYVFTVVDACDDRVSIPHVVEPMTLTADIGIGNSVACLGNNGIIPIYPKDGTPPYTVKIDSKPDEYTGSLTFKSDSSVLTIKNLAIGNYDFTVFDKCMDNVKLSSKVEEIDYEFPQLDAHDGIAYPMGNYRNHETQYYSEPKGPGYSLSNYVGNYSIASCNEAYALLNISTINKQLHTHLENYHACHYYPSVSRDNFGAGRGSSYDYRSWDYTSYYDSFYSHYCFYEIAFSVDGERNWIALDELSNASPSYRKVSYSYNTAKLYQELRFELPDSYRNLYVAGKRKVEIYLRSKVPDCGEIYLGSLNLQMPSNKIVSTVTDNCTTGYEYSFSIPDDRSLCPPYRWEIRDMNDGLIGYGNDISDITKTQQINLQYGIEYILWITDNEGNEFTQQLPRRTVPSSSRSYPDYYRMYCDNYDWEFFVRNQNPCNPPYDYNYSWQLQNADGSPYKDMGWQPQIGTKSNVINGLEYGKTYKLIAVDAIYDTPIEINVRSELPADDNFAVTYHDAYLRFRCDYLFRFDVMNSYCPHNYTWEVFDDQNNLVNESDNIVSTSKHSYYGYYFKENFVRLEYNKEYTIRIIDYKQETVIEEFKYSCSDENQYTKSSFDIISTSTLLDCESVGNINIFGNLYDGMRIRFISGMQEPVYTNTLLTGYGYSNWLVTNFYPFSQDYHRLENVPIADGEYSFEITNLCGETEIRTISYTNKKIKYENFEVLVSQTDDDICRGISRADLKGDVYENGVRKPPVFTMIDPDGKSYSRTNGYFELTKTGRYVINLTYQNCLLDSFVVYHERESFTLQGYSAYVCEEGGNGHILVEAKNGVPPYSYQLLHKDGNTLVEENSTGKFNIGALNETYMVKISDRCKTAFPIFVTINPLDSKKLISGITDICEGEDIELYCTLVGDVSPIWTKPNGITYNGKNLIIPNAKPTDSGTYTVTVQPEGCTSTISGTVEVTVHELPSLLPKTIFLCSTEKTYQFSTISAECHSLQWYNEQESPLSGQSPVIDVSENDEYHFYVTQVDNNYGCTNEKAEVIIKKIPTAEITMTLSETKACKVDALNDPSTITVSPTPALIGGTLTYSGDIAIGANSTFSTAGLSVGVKNIKLDYTDANGCKGSATTIFTINPLPTVKFLENNPTEVCANYEQQLYVSPMPNYTTTFGGFIGADPNGIFTSNINGGIQYFTYTYRDENGCKGSATHNIKSVAVPAPKPISKEVQIDTDNNLSDNTDLTAELPKNVDVIQWFDKSNCGVFELPSTANGTTFATGKTAADADKSFTWNIRASEQIAGGTICYSPCVDAVLILTKCPAKAPKAENPHFCENATDNVGATATQVLPLTPNSYLAWFDENSNPIGKKGTKPTGFLQKTDTYTIINGAATAGTRNFYVAEYSVTNDCWSEGTLVTITISNSNTTRINDNIFVGEDYNKHGFTIPIQNTIGTILCTLHLKNQFLCDSIVILELLVKPNYTSKDSTKTFVDNCIVYIPNAFSPTNSAASVRMFKPIAYNLEYCKLWIYDKWGNLLYYSNEVHNGTFTGEWNGTYNGELLQSDVYIWKMEAKFLDGTTWAGQKKAVGGYSKFGNVVLIR